MQLSAFGKGWRTLAYKVPLKKLIMQLTVLAILLTGVPARAHVFSQTVSIAANNMPLEKVFVEIKKQTGYTFAYFESDLAKARPVNINVTNAKLTEVLAAIFDNQPLTYTIVEKVIVVKTKSEKKIVVSGDAFSALPIDVRGKVVNEEGEPVAGATVLVKGTKNATATTGEGEFVLRNVDPTAILVVTGVNILSIEESIKNRKDVILQVKGKTGKLDEVQVIAYGTTSQRFNTGNVGTVKAADIEKQPVNNPLLALQGRVPGLVITPVSGVPGASITIRIQGQNSIGNSNEPLIVIDGVPYPSQNDGPGTISSILGGTGSALSYINPADIESMDVLKDADATAIYGSRAANGAILITTKKGKQGRTNVNVDLQQGWSKAVSHMDLLNSQQYMEMRREAKRNDNAAIRTADYDLRGVWDTTRYTDWQKVLIGNTAKSTRATAGVSGGTSNIQYIISGTYGRETTIYPGNFADKKGSLHFSISASSANQRFRIQLSGSYMVDKNELPIADLSSIILLAPVAPALFTSDGNLNWAPDPLTGASSWKNPMSYIYSLYDNDASNLVSNSLLSYRLLPGLEVKGSFGYTTTQINEFGASFARAVNPESQPNFPISRVANYTESRLKSWIFEPQVSYNQSMGQAKINLLVGGSFQQRENFTSAFKGTGYSSDLLVRSIQSATTITADNYSAYIYKYNAGFAKVNINIADKYLLNFTARRDGSSRFGSENYFHNFGAIGLGWIFSQEKSVKDVLQWLSFGKLRGSYGTTGSDQIGDYRVYSSYRLMGSLRPYQGGGTGLILNGINNPYLQWEETRKLQAGIDLGFLRDKILFTVNYSRNRSSNQLLEYNLPVITGVPGISSNFPALVQNTGWEFSLNTQNIRSARFSWSSNINLTIPRNKLVDFPNFENSPYVNTLIIGQPLAASKNYSFYGVNPINGVYLVTDSKGNPTVSPDFNKDANFLQDPTPRFYGGALNSFEYSGFQLDFFFQFSMQKGNYVLRAALPAGYLGPDGQSNQPINVLNRWQKPGDITAEAKFTTGSSTYSNTANRTWGDASYIRLKNISVSYKLPGIYQKRWHVQNAKLFCNAQNLFTLTRFIGLDPETGGTNFLPPLKTLAVGFQVSL